MPCLSSEASPCGNHSRSHAFQPTSVLVRHLTVLCCFQDVHGAMSGDPESDSEGSSLENLGDVTQFGLTGALAQMANLTFMAGAPGNLFTLTSLRYIYSTCR